MNPLDAIGDHYELSAYCTDRHRIAVPIPVDIFDQDPGVALSRAVAAASNAAAAANRAVASWRCRLIVVLGADPDHVLYGIPIGATHAA